METKKIKINNYNLQMIKTDKYKTVTLDFIFSIPISKENITMTKILSSILCLSTNNFKTRRDLEIRKEELYSCDISCDTYKLGNYYNADFFLSCLNDKYTEKGNLLNAFSLIKDIIFNPYVVNSRFDDNNLDLIKRSAINTIKGIYEEPAYYGFVKMLDNMGEDIYSLHEYGYEDIVNACTASNLFEFYKYFMNNSHVEVLIIGDIDFDEIEDYFRNNINFNNYDLLLSYYKHSKTMNVKNVSDDYPSTQTKLSIGYKILNPTKYELEYVLPLFNLILGGDTDAHLHNKIREDNGLCYYIYSSYQKLNSIFYINSGINKKDMNQVVSLVDQEIENILNDLSNEELLRAKNKYNEKLDKLDDSPENILSIYYQKEILGTELLEERKHLINNVTCSDIKNLIPKIDKNIIYLLGGNIDEEV